MNPAEFGATLGRVVKQAGSSRVAASMFYDAITGKVLKKALAAKDGKKKPNSGNERCK